MSAVWGADDADDLTIVEQEGRAELSGRKILASGAGFVTRPIVTAKSADGQLMCLLKLSPDQNADLSSWTAQGMRSTATGAVELSGIRIGSDEIIGSAGDFMRQPYFSGGAWRFCRRIWEPWSVWSNCSVSTWCRAVALRIRISFNV
jgi:alkylation response protein AidB-like acyl-CoA dehydrogenase